MPGYGIFKPGHEGYRCPSGSGSWVNQWLEDKVKSLSVSKTQACDTLENDRQALQTLLSLSFSKKIDFLAALVYPSDFSPAAQKFDNLTWEYLQQATGLSLLKTADNNLGYECPLNTPKASFNSKSFQNNIASVPLSKGGGWVCLNCPSYSTLPPHILPHQANFLTSTQRLNRYHYLKKFNITDV